MKKSQLHIVTPESEPRKKKRKLGEPVPGIRTIRISRIVNRVDQKPEPGTQAAIDALPADYEPMYADQLAVMNADRKIKQRSGWTRFILKLKGQ